MSDATYMASELLSAMGLTIIIVWSQDGPAAWMRERFLRRVLPPQLKGVLDCYVCTGFWAGLALSPLWWAMCHAWWAWGGCLMVPTLFWLALDNPSGPAP